MRAFLAGLVLLASGPGPAFAQTVLGPGRCTSCHTHDEQAGKWQRDEPARLGARAHFAAMGRLDDSRARAFARAVGLESPYAVEGSCVRCHTTVFRGRANAGVSCESCHGPSSGWIELHQEKGTYERSLAKGLTGLKERPDAIARLCVSCHAVDDARLLAAGHPSGASFDAGARLREILHWTTRYDYAQITVAGRKAMPGLLAAALPAAPQAAAPSPPEGVEAPKPATPGRWEAARPLPPGYVPEASPAATTPQSPFPAPLPEAAPPDPARLASLAEDFLLPVAPRLQPMNPAGPTPTPTAEALAARGRALLLLSRLLRTGARLEGAAAPAPGDYPGPDGELWRLQDEVYALLSETFKKASP